MESGSPNTFVKLKILWVWSLKLFDEIFYSFVDSKYFNLVKRGFFRICVSVYIHSGHVVPREEERDLYRENSLPRNSLSTCQQERQPCFRVCFSSVHDPCLRWGKIHDGTQKEGSNLCDLTLPFFSLETFLFFTFIMSPQDHLSDFIVSWSFDNQP